MLLSLLQHPSLPGFDLHSGPNAPEFLGYGQRGHSQLALESLCQGDNYLWIWLPDPTLYSSSHGQHHPKVPRLSTITNCLDSGRPG